MLNEKDIKIGKKSKEISYEDIHNVLKIAHEDIRKKDIIFSTTNLSGKNMQEIIGDNGICFVALDGTKVVGTLSACIEDRKFWYYSGKVVNMRFGAVLPEYQGCHIFSRLIKEVQQFSVEKQIDLIVVATPENHTSAIKIYERNGFQLVDFFIYQGKLRVRMAYWKSGPNYSKYKRLLKYNYMKYSCKFKIIVKNMLRIDKGL